MKKSALLWMITLALGWYAPAADAQEPLPDKKIKIILKEANGDVVVHEYNSLEEMQADERLKAKKLEDLFLQPLNKVADRDILLQADTIRLLNNSEGKKRSRIFMHESQEGSKEGDQVYISKSIEGEVAIIKPGESKRDNILKHGPLSLEELPAEAQKFLQERGLVLKEGQKLVIVHTLDSMPEPPAPPAPPAEAALLAVPEPPAPPLPLALPEPPPTSPVPLALPESVPVPSLPADLSGAAELAELPGWLEELQVFPNPADDQLRVRFRSNASGPAVLRLLDLNGKVVYEEQIKEAGAAIDRTIKIPAAKKGIMLLQLEQGGQKLNHRVLRK